MGKTGKRPQKKKARREQPADPPAEPKDRLAEVYDALSVIYARTPTEDALVAAAARFLTGEAEFDKLVLEWVDLRLAHPPA